MESFSTHKCQETGLIFIFVKKKKKSLIKPEDSLVLLRPIHDDSQSYQFERLGKFFFTNTRTQRGFALDHQGPRC